MTNIIWGCVGFIICALFIFAINIAIGAAHKKMYAKIFRMSILGILSARVDIMDSGLGEDATKAIIKLGEGILGGRLAEKIVAEEYEFIDKLMKEESDG